MNRHPVTQQRYAIRRLGVATVLALGVFGAVRVVSSLTENKAAGEAPPSSLAGDGSATGVPGADPTTVAPTTPPPPTERSGPPTEDNPAQVLVVGDSDAGVFGPYLQNVVEEWDVVDVTLDYTSSTGLARPDSKVDWPVRLRLTLASSDPDIIVVTFGGNDAQGLASPCTNGPDTCDPQFVVGMPTTENQAEWTAEYGARVANVMDIMLEDPDRTVIWVGIPNDIDSADVTERLRIQDRAVRQALEGLNRAVFIDTWSIFDGINGGRAELIVDPRTGDAIPVRAIDGFHLNEDGAEILAVTVADHMKDVLNDMGSEL